MEILNYNSQEIVSKLRKVEVLCRQGMPHLDAIRQICDGFDRRQSENIPGFTMYRNNRPGEAATQEVLDDQVALRHIFGRCANNCKRLRSNQWRQVAFHETCQRVCCAGNVQRFVWFQKCIIAICVSSRPGLQIPVTQSNWIMGCVGLSRVSIWCPHFACIFWPDATLINAA